MNLMGKEADKFGALTVYEHTRSDVCHCPHNTVCVCVCNAV